MCSGNSSKQEMTNADNTRTDELNLMRQQLGLQMNQINQVNGVLDPMIANGGMSAGEENALNSLAINQLPADFRQTAGMINQNLAARGISGGTSGAGSGDVARQFGNLGAMEDYLKNTALTNVQLQKAAQLRNLLGIKMGVAGMFGQNTGMFNSGGLSALNSGVTAANNADQAESGFWGSVIGAGLGAGTSFIPKPKGAGCWIARAVYGDGPVAEFIRQRLWMRAETSVFYRLLMKLYMKFGERIAERVERSPRLQIRFKSIFDRFFMQEAGLNA